jgi:hypothetical protein
MKSLNPELGEGLFIVGARRLKIATAVITLKLAF